MLRSNTLIALALAAAAMLHAGATSAATTIYRTVDEHGNVVFTDVAPKDGEPGKAVELNRPNSFPPPEPDRAGRSVEEWLRGDQGAGGPDGDADDAPAHTGYDSLSIASPVDDAPVRDNAGNVVITAAVQPDLRPTDTLQLYLDGALRQTGQTTSFALSNVDRGTHRAELRIVDQGGNTVASSDPVTFHMQRRSVILQPAPRSR